MHNLIRHIGYMNRRKEELKNVDRHKLINDLIIKELEIKEYEKENICRECGGSGEINTDPSGIDGHTCYDCDGTGRRI